MRDGSLPGIVVDPAGKLPTKYFGLAAIGARLGCANGTVLNWYTKQGLPMFRRSCNRKWSRDGWTWYLDESLVVAWLIVTADNQRKAWLQTRPGRARTTRESCINRGRRIPLEHQTEADRAAIANPIISST